MRRNLSRTGNKLRLGEKALRDIGVGLGAPESFARGLKKLFICNTAADIFFYNQC